MSSDIVILDGLVTISDEPYTDVYLTGAHVRRWGDAEIRRYQLNLRRWSKYHRLPRFLRGWLKVPNAKPSDRSRALTGCTFVDDSGRYTGLKVAR